MFYLLLISALAFVFVNGRNDGAALVAIATQTTGVRLYYPLLLLWLFLPLVPLLGVWKVADSLRQMAGLESMALASACCVLLSTLLTVWGSGRIGIPTSITLALVGALSGDALARSVPLDGALLGRTVGLGLLAPFVAALIAALISLLPFHPPRPFSANRWLKSFRATALTLLALAYAANDGQKVLFAVALILAAPVGTVALNVPIMFAASTLFIAGAIAGLPSASRFLRHGITALDPLKLLQAELATGVTVLAGSAVGTPLSMTQSITGALLGTGLVRSTRAVRWDGIARIGVAWIWTLPAAGLLAFGAEKLVSTLSS
ncbi:inorganic phosphate transporter [Scrofimicrobium sp. R131]|uniref:Inorganic phosphate transporter n=1 Tax=Scrofimicrobium appendicitidis TaxID=3079930 RepID=A0AAU7V8C2_9ACTO